MTQSSWEPLALGTCVNNADEHSAWRQLYRPRRALRSGKPGALAERPSRTPSRGESAVSSTRGSPQRPLWGSGNQGNLINAVGAVAAPPPLPAAGRAVASRLLVVVVRLSHTPCSTRALSPHLVARHPAAVAAAAAAAAAAALLLPLCCCSFAAITARSSVRIAAGGGAGVAAATLIERGIG